MSDVGTQISSSVDSLMQQFDVITHNLANVSTVGYKRMCNSFSAVLDSQQTGEAQGTTEIALESVFDFSQGNIIETSRPLDFALHGNGFFVIETLEGPLYTRNGIFRINQNGQIVDSEARTVAGESGPITIPADVSPSQLSVSTDGSISADGVTIGQFRLVDFPENQSELVSVGAGCFSMPNEDIQPIPAENLIVKQGYQESSNVQMVEELVNMIMVTRTYEANMKFISAQKEIGSSLIDVAMA